MQGFWFSTQENAIRNAVQEIVAPLAESVMRIERRFDSITSHNVIAQSHSIEGTDYGICSLKSYTNDMITPSQELTFLSDTLGDESRLASSVGIWTRATKP